ncbi:MmcQ/YjbR family DNA-binding protein [Amycolatopsis mediterranei]|uniref:MmcQ/YjbR family DNA-binding protein n=1 Tax=Amycolatopsis mediterranei TaxID=33910 RepID=UPI00342C1414
MVTGDEVRAFASTLPRAHEALVRDRIKFRVGQLVFAALSADETLMGFAFPREQREALIAAEPGKFLLPEASDLRFRWVRCRLAAIDAEEMRELVVEAWRMCVPKKVWTAYLETHPL